MQSQRTSIEQIMKTNQRIFICALLVSSCILAVMRVSAQKARAIDTSFVTVHIKGQGLSRDFRESNSDGQNRCLAVSELNFVPAKDTAMKGISIGTVTTQTGDGAQVTINLDHITGPCVMWLPQTTPKVFSTANPNLPYVFLFQVDYISHAGGAFPGSSLNVESIVAAPGDDPHNTGSVTVTEYHGPGSHMKGHFTFRV